MLVLLDNCVDIRLAKLIEGHDVRHARELGWRELTNGKLLSAAEMAGFEVMITTDKGLRHQQNFASRTICLITLSPVMTDLIYLVPLVPKVVELLNTKIDSGSIFVIKP